mgnify:FL=1
MKTKHIIKFLRKTNGVTIRPYVVCKDGFKVSIQASEFHYSDPKDDVDSGEYYNVELGYPSEIMSYEISQYAECAENEEDLLETIYAYVPIDLVEKELQRHGGIDWNETLDRKYEVVGKHYLMENLYVEESVTPDGKDVWSLKYNWGNKTHHLCPLMRHEAKELISGEITIPRATDITDEMLIKRIEDNIIYYEELKTHEDDMDRAWRILTVTLENRWIARMLVAGRKKK